MNKKYITLSENDQVILQGMIVKRSFTIKIHERVESLLLLLNLDLKLISAMQ